MKKVLLLTIALIGTFSIASAQDFDAPMMDLDSQWEITVGAVQAAVADGYGNSASVTGGQVSIAYDFFDTSFKLAPEVDFNVAGGSFGFLPGLQIGHDNIYGLLTYNIDLEVPYYGIGGRIDLNESSAISLGLQGGKWAGIGIGYGNIGYTFKF